MSDADRAAKLAATLDFERDAYTRIRALSAEQLEAARAGDTERLERLLAEKGALVEKLEANADAEARAGWNELRDALPAETRAQLEQRIEEVASLLAAIVKLEDEARDELVNRRGAAIEGLERLATARRVNRAYGDAGSPPPPGAQMTDQRG